MWPSISFLTTLAAAEPPAAVRPTAEAIREKAAEVVARPEFDLQSGIDRESLSLAFRILMWILKPIRWFLEALAVLPEPLWWLVVIGLVVLLLALCGHIIWTFMTAIRSPSAKKKRGSTPERLTSPEELETAAASSAAEGGLIGAIRCLFRACLIRIERTEKRPFRRGITNREILRRYRSSPLFEPLSRMVELIDTRWYGHDPCLESDYESCRSGHQEIRRIVERGAHVPRP